MFNRAFDGLGANRDDYYPEALRDEIDAINERVYRTVNNGVYRAGFATTQEAYEEAVVLLFESLDWLEDRLSRHRYLTGSATCEADWRLATTLFRFDPVYVGHFKCNLKRIVDYPNLAAYTPGSVSAAGHCRNGAPRSHQGALLRQPRIDQSQSHRPRGPRNRLRGAP